MVKHMPVLEEVLTSRFFCLAKSRKKIGLLPGSMIQISGVISGTFKVSSPAFTLERSLCESCDRLAKEIGKVRVFEEDAAILTGVECKYMFLCCFFFSIACRIFSILGLIFPRNYNM